MSHRLLDKNQVILSRFPKCREPLPAEYQEFHGEFYSAARHGKHVGARVALRLERWMHRKAALEPALFPLLEIGAGTLNHVVHEAGSGEYDIVEPMKGLYSGSPCLSRISGIYDDIMAVPAERKYERIISIATLEHVLDLPMVVARSCLHLTPEGEFRSGIPSEGGLLWYTAYTFGSGITFRLKYGLSYSRFQRYEHVNKAWEIERVVGIFFEDLAVTRWPLAPLHCSLYTFLSARKPRVDVARSYLERARKL